MAALAIVMSAVLIPARRQRIAFASNIGRDVDKCCSVHNVQTMHINGKKAASEKQPPASASDVLNTIFRVEQVLQRLCCLLQSLFDLFDLILDLLDLRHGLADLLSSCILLRCGASILRLWPKPLVLAVPPCCSGSLASLVVAVPVVPACCSWALVPPVAVVEFLHAKAWSLPMTMNEWYVQRACLLYTSPSPRD